MQLQPPPETDDIDELKDWLRLLYEWLKSPVFNQYYMNPTQLPTSAQKCHVLWDEDQDKLRFYDGAEWQDVTKDATLTDYYEKAGFLSSSDGAADAGSPIILDADGDVDATMINSADVDHDTTTNFVADEHVAYTSVTLTAGTGLTGGGDISTDRSFAVIQQSHIADATTSHDVTGADSVDQSQLESDLDALGTKINAILTALETAEILATS